MADTIDGTPNEDNQPADLGSPDAAAPQNKADEANEAPRLTIHTQYLKDLSFENPSAPDSLKSTEQPETNVKVDIQAKKLEDDGDLYEVALQVTAEATRGGATVFVAEVSYAGIFTIQVKPELVRPAVMIECPRLIFPFARQILADAVRNGGFPPLLLQPVDFVEIYRQDLAQRQQQAPGGVSLG